MLQKARAYPHLGKMPFFLAAAATEKQQKAGEKTCEVNLVSQRLGWVGKRCHPKKTP